MRKRTIMSRLRRSAKQLLDAPAPDLYHVPAADGFRAACVGLVGAFHVWQLSWLPPRLGPVNLEPMVRTGYLAVDLMLMLSGFLLYLPHARALALGERLPRAGAFYKKRALRILPSYWLCLVVTLAIFLLEGGRYPGPGQMAYDILSHLSFTHNLSYATAIATPLNGVLWTLAVEVQFYLIFPLLARGFARRPLTAYLLMVGAALAYRTGWAAAQPDTTLWVNRLPGMLDVYANGMLAAQLYVSLARALKGDRITGLGFGALSALLLLGIYALMRTQGPLEGEARRLGQLQVRFLLSAYGALFLVCASNASLWMRRLLDNRLTAFLSAISFNYYIWHQYLAVKLRQWRLPPYQAPEPYRVAEQPWQGQYVTLCVLGALLLAVSATYLLERPAARLGARLLERRGRNGRAAPPAA